MAKDNMDRFEQLYRWLKPQLRRLCRRWPPYYQVLNKARIVKYIPTKSGHGQLKRVFYACVECKQEFDRKGVQIDHIHAVVDVTLGNGKPDFNELIARMFCDVDGLQILCTECHSKKSSYEREQRKQHTPLPKRKRKAKKKA